jgi:hypothetical protein
MRLDCQALCKSIDAGDSFHRVARHRLRDAFQLRLEKLGSGRSGPACPGMEWARRHETPPCIPAQSPLRAVLIALPGVNFAPLDAAIVIASPVCGLRPCLSPRSVIPNVSVLHRDGRGKEGPIPPVDQATRTEFGHPRSSIRLRTWAAMATSVALASSLWKRSPSPMTCFQRANWPSTSAL